MSFGLTQNVDRSSYGVWGAAVDSRSFRMKLRCKYPLCLGHPSCLGSSMSKTQQEPDRILHCSGAELQSRYGVMGLGFQIGSATRGLVILQYPLRLVFCGSLFFIGLTRALCLADPQAHIDDRWGSCLGPIEGFGLFGVGGVSSSRAPINLMTLWQTSRVNPDMRAQKTT